MPDEAVYVDGLSGLIKGLRAADRDLPRALTEVHRAVAEGIVAAARPKLLTKYGKQQAKVKIAASGTQRGAFIRLSGEAAMGAEFGAATLAQFRPWRGSGQGAGYAVYPTIRAQRETIMDRYANSVEEKVLKRIAETED